MKYSVTLHLLAHSGTVEQLTAHIDDVADELADLDAVCDAMLDWTLGVELAPDGTARALVEAQFTVDAESPVEASREADGWMWMAVRAAGGDLPAPDFTVTYAVDDEAVSVRPLADASV